MIPTLATRPIDASYISEVLEVAENVLQRNHDHDLARKMLALREILETNKKRRRLDCSEALDKALADVTTTVKLHLSAELEAVAAIWRPYLTNGNY